MSYILDALRKSDEKRNMLNPSVETGPGKHHGRARLPLFIWVCIALAGTAFFGWWIAKRDQPVTTAPSAMIPAPERLPVATPHPQADKPESPAIMTPANAGHPASQAEQPAHPVHAGSAAESEAPTAPEGGALIKPAAPSGKKITAVTDPHAPVPDYPDLPEEMLNSLPPIHIEGHIYDANPSARMIVINGHVRHEGQKIGKALVLEEITANGAILNYQGMLFRIGVFNGQE
jgi:hypothetical protein